MKFRKYSDFKNCNSYFKAKKNNITFDIHWDNLTNRYWVSIEDLKTDISFNSLWRGISFTKEELLMAKRFCEELAEYYKINRITQVSDCESRVDDFLSTFKRKDS